MKTQIELILRYLKTHKTITPAKLVARNMYGGFTGSELPRACRRLRQLNILGSYREEFRGKKSKYVTFYLY